MQGRVASAALFLWTRSHGETKVRCARTKNEPRAYPPYRKMTIWVDTVSFERSEKGEEK
jgi:hypothetical protein